MERPLRVNIMGDDLTLSITDTNITPTDGGFSDVTISTSGGEVLCRYYRAEGSDRAVLMVGGVGGDFDTPANGLYPRLAEALLDRGVSSLRVRYRYPDDLSESAMDVLAALRFLKGQGVTKAALIGHSLGGAVVIQAAAKSSIVKTVITLSTQSYGADALSEFKDGVSSLFIHGAKDPVLPARCSSYAYYVAKEPKEFIVHDEADHSLDQASEKIYDEIMSWLSANLK